MSTRSSRQTSSSSSTQPSDTNAKHTSTNPSASPRLSSIHNVTIKPTTAAKPAGYTPTHHVNSPPTSFKNPWPSAPPPYSLATILQARFFNSAEKNFVPVPTDRSVLVSVTKPDWGWDNNDTQQSNTWKNLKATWIGHASFLIEFPSQTPHQRGVRILLDPVFSERMSPVSFLGPKRFTPTPCAIEDLPEVDVICISHNHYDHMDAATIRYVRQRARARVKVLCGLGVGANLRGMGLEDTEIVEMDWWDGVVVSVDADGVRVGDVRVVCTPSQHTSGRGLRDHGSTLWCSYAFEDVSRGTSVEGADVDEVAQPRRVGDEKVGKRLFFAGDTAYRSVPRDATEDQIEALPVCPAFKQMGDLYGPFDLALLPIGCYSPRWWMSAVHCAPEESICVHRDVKSKLSIGMHWGVLRGGISQYYEDVTEPPKRWKESCEKAGLKWQEEIGLCGVGETVQV